MKLSILMPVYNEHQTLHEILDQVRDVFLEEGGAPTIHCLPRLCMRRRSCRSAKASLMEWWEIRSLRAKKSNLGSTSPLMRVADRISLSSSRKRRLADSL